MILRNANILNVFTGEWIGGDIKIEGGIITGIGDYSDEGDFVDIGGRSIVPGFINTHVHIESTMVTPRQYAAEILPWGTTTAIADPHEIANVAGLPGVEFMIDQSKDLPCNIYFMLPSCVPATPYDDNAIALEAEELFKLKDNPAVLGLGEMMDCPGVLNNNPEVFAKLKLFYGDKSKIIDGHAPFLSGKDLQKYRASGIITDHECSTAEEVLEKIRAGIYILAREGSYGCGIIRC
jgi:adenine deaminase